MNMPLQPILTVPVRQLSPLALADLANECRQALGNGSRLLAFYGRPEADRWLVTAVLLTPASGLRVLRATAAPGESYPALTPSFPAVQILERELWEQTGLVPKEHPWLKPVRFEGARQGRTAEYPFFSVRGEEIHEVGVGPIHASVIEPGHFRFMCHGERVMHLEIQLGYQHRGVERLLLGRPPLTLASQVESIAGDTSIAYAWGYCAAVEALGDARIPMAVNVVRGIALELERIAMHLVALGGLATDIAFLQGGATYGRLRTAIINATMRVCGSRFGRGWLRPGGVRHAIHDGHRRDLLETLTAFSADMTEVDALMLGARSVQSRFKGVGTLSRTAALDLGIVGLAARASGVGIDTRQALPGELYATHPTETLTEDSGDCWARLVLRMREIDAAVRWLRTVLQDSRQDLNTGAPVPPRVLAGSTLCVCLCEGFRGPVLQALETGADGQLVHYKVQDPSLFNWFALAQAVRDNEISDFPICNKSFDLSYCGNDL